MLKMKHSLTMDKVVMQLLTIDKRSETVKNRAVTLFILIYSYTKVPYKEKK